MRGLSAARSSPSCATNTRGHASARGRDEWVRQIKDELFTELPVRVLSAETSCAAAPAAQTRVRVSLQALRADSPGKSAAAAPAASGMAQASTSIAKQQR